jgi:flagellar biosynthetic protein FliS
MTVCASGQAGRTRRRGRRFRKAEHQIHPRFFEFIAMTQLPGAPSRYLDARVTTASQPELQLMLLDGAIRFVQQAQGLWDADNQRAECRRLLGRATDIVEELVRAAAAGTAPPSKRLEEEYAFAFRELALAQLNEDPARLESALKLLSVQRETWKLVCQRLKAELPPGAAGGAPGGMPAGAGVGLSLQA